jgi:hypothetical protein
MSKKSPWLIAVIVALLTQNSAAAQAPVGIWVAVDPSGGAINTAIANAAHDFNFIVRSIAKKRLRAANPIPRTLSISESGGSIEVVLNGNLRVRAKPGSTITWRGPDNDPVKVTTVLEGDALTQTFVADDGTKRNRYRVRSDGQLQLDVHVTSSKLKRPLDYTQLFRKQT